MLQYSLDISIHFRFQLSLFLLLLQVRQVTEVVPMHLSSPSWIKTTSHPSNLLSTDTRDMLYTLMLVMVPHLAEVKIFVFQIMPMQILIPSQTLAVPIDYQAGIPTARPRRGIFLLALINSHLTRLKHFILINFWLNSHDVDFAFRNTVR